MSQDQTILTAQRVRTLIARHLSSNGPADSVEQAVLMEMITLTHRGNSQEVLNATKDPLKHGVPQVQLRLLTLLDRIVQNTSPDFVLCLATEDWTERLFRISKTATSHEVADKIMILTLDCYTRYPVEGLKSLINRFANSKVVGERFAFLKQDYDRRRATATTEGSQSGGSPNVQYGGYADPNQDNTPNRRQPHVPQNQPRTQRVNLDTLLMDVQGDMAGLEYGIQHPDMLDSSTARDCAKHRQTLSKILDNPAHVISEHERNTVLMVLEQLVNLLSFHDALTGTTYAQGAGIANRSGGADSPVPHAEDRYDPELAAALRASLTDAQPSRPRTEGEKDALEAGVASPRTARPAGAMFGGNPAELEEQKRKVAEIAAENSSLQARLRGAETAKADLEAELKKLEDALEAQKAKYATAKAKNKEAVAATEDLDREIEECKQQIAHLTTQLEQKSNAPVIVPEVREVTKWMKPKVSGALLQRINAGIVESRKDLHALRKDGRALASVADQFVADITPRIGEIVRAAGVDREKDASELRALQALYKREVQRRKMYYNQIQELKGNIRVYCRFRPMSDTELANGHTEVATYPSDDEVRIIDDKQRIKTFEFDTVFGPNSTQEAVFADTMPLIDSVVDGYNVCIFAYGQTGSGKTHTMSGTLDSPGINRRALERLFEVIREREDTEESHVKVNVLEIYNDNIRDLLVPKKNLAKSYEIHPGGKYGNYVSNLTEEDVQSADSINEIMTRASSNRTEGATNMNAHSSRSHMVVYIVITTRNKQTNAESYGKLSLVDLAGSERLDKSGAEGQAAKEAVAINKSLTALGDTIAALSQSAKHVPYRNSTLTHLLQDSMSGNAKVLMFCCASPASYNTPETVSSLTFALRARGVSLGQVKKNTA
jgi:kinesin family protein C2/C3